MKSLLDAADKEAKSSHALRQASEENRKREGAEYQRRIQLLEEDVASLRRELEAKAPKAVAVREGRILQVDLVEERAIINLGGRDRIESGEIFTVMAVGKGGERIPKAQLKVVRVEDLVSRVDIMNVEAEQTILRGDIVWRAKDVESRGE
jgi:hypothetical protein